MLSRETEMLFSRLDCYDVLKTLGKGATSKVKLLQEPTSRILYAAKIFKYSQDDIGLRDQVYTEIECLNRISHKRVIKYFNYCEGGVYRKKNQTSYRCLYILMEYCINGEFYDLINDYGSLDTYLCRFYFRQLIEALEACHRVGVYHGDIKLENLLLDSEFNLKLIDFGSSNYKNLKDLFSIRGTENYMPPEIRQNSRYDPEKVDVFEAGVLLFIMFVGVPPFNFADISDNFYRCLIGEETSKIFWRYHQKKRENKIFTTEFTNLIERMLAFNPGDRPSITDIKEDVWFNAEVPNKEEIVRMIAYLKTNNSES
ncbi:unnamed protein product [Blepharisma stoltei]|uniref:Protein kinase domain-containing protein n=1 Tax=Blepharisma stoltei TaxID=1481888 RepID=A0AAU9IBL9_9CILI|nr:unnamed protein product [Blepharisma stoltei]